MENISPDTVLYRRTGITLAIESDNAITLQAGGIRFSGGAHVMSVIDLFAQPMAFGAALQALQPRVHGVQDWMDISSTIHSLYSAGLLVRHNAVAPAELGLAGFGAAPIHAAMLNDRTRTERFIQAIGRTVKPGDVVVDIGTGTGVLSVAAARAGAARVYAIEAGAMAGAAQAVFRANNVQDTVTLLRGWSTGLTLPERADVLVSEIIGSEPLSERIIETTRDAVARFLKPGARLIPQSLSIHALPVTIPARHIADRCFTAERAQTWRGWYGMNFDPLAAMGQAGPPQRYYLKPHSLRGWPALSAPIHLCTLPLGDLQSASVDVCTRQTLGDHGVLNGLIVYFSTVLMPGLELTTHPHEAGEDCSWAVPIWILPEPCQVHPGDTVEITYRYRAGGGENTSVNATVHRAGTKFP